jgi:transcription elongation factor Elf1
MGYHMIDVPDQPARTKKRRIVYIRWFGCPECGAVVTATKGQKTPAGHIKTMYCPICKTDRRFMQVDIEALR